MSFGKYVVSNENICKFCNLVLNKIECTAKSPTKMKKVSQLTFNVTSDQKKNLQKGSFLFF